jgi:cytochrome c biogenesis protein CcdA
MGNAAIPLLPFAALCAVTLLNALHPMLTNTFQMAYGSLLGNEVPPKKSAARLGWFALAVSSLWLLVGVVIVLATGFHGMWSSIAARIFAIVAISAGLIEVSSFVRPRHHAMHFSHESWRRWRKQAYKITTSHDAFMLGLRTSAWLFLYAGAPYVLALTLLRTPVDLPRIGEVFFYSILLGGALWAFSIHATTSHKLGVLQWRLQHHQRAVHLTQGLLTLFLGVLWIIYHAWRLS